MAKINPEEILIDKLSQQKKIDLKMETTLSLLPFFLFFGLILVCFLIFLVRAFQFQFLEKENYLSLAQKNEYIIQKLKAERGVIFDRNGEQLVFNKLEFNLYLEKTAPSSSVENLAKILKEEKSEIEKKIKESNKEKVLIKKNLSIDQAVFILSEKEKLQGLEIKEETKREYKDGEIFAHLIGYLGKKTEQEFEGKEGLEFSLEEILKPKLGEILIKRTGEKEETIVSQPESGKNVVLYLDANLQRKIYETLQKREKEIGAKSAAAVALDPKTGGVLSLVSLPSFNPNLFFSADTTKINQILEDPFSPLFNRATNGQFPLGSTIKPLEALAGLSEKLISNSSSIDCQGKIVIKSPFSQQEYVFKDWREHGLTDLEKAIAESCNIYFYNLGKILGPTKIKEYLEKFGISKKIETDFPIKNSGFIGDPKWKKETKKENWWDGDTFNLSIGQGYIFSNPFEIARAFLPVANKGNFLKPKFIWKILSEKGETISETKPEVWRENFLDLKDLEIVRKGMRKAVTGEGAPFASAKSLNTLPFSVAVKTGTAQDYKIDCKNCYTVWTVAFAPYEDPQILLVLTMEGVKDISSAILIPAAREILEWYFSKP
jgi:penicillin-binding protein 2